VNSSFHLLPEDTVRPLSRWTRFLLVAAGVAALSCSGDGNGGDPVEPETGSVRATVTGEGDPLPGVTVRLFADGGNSALASLNTAANGQVTFAELDPGAYDVDVVVPAGFELAAGQTLRRDVTVEAEQTQSVTFALEEIEVLPTVGQIRARVVEGEDGVPDVEVILFPGAGGAALDTLTTADDGRVLFESLDPGAYEVEITLPTNFEAAEGDTTRKDVNVTAGVTTDVEFEVVGPPETVIEIDVSNFAFSDEDLTIAPGTTVRWVLVSGTHTVTPVGHSEWTSPTLDTAGEEFEHTFDNTGDFPYECAFHPQMTGIVRVQ